MYVVKFLAQILYTNDPLDLRLLMESSSILFNDVLQKMSGHETEGRQTLSKI